MKPILIGEAPSKNEVTETPLEGRIGKRLARLCGLSLAEYLEHFERINLLHTRQDTRERGFEFDHAAAARAAHELWMHVISPGRVVLLLGKRVARAFDEQKDYFEEHRTVQGIRFFVLPHPSGVNHWWNDEANYRKAAEFMQWIVVETTREAVDA